MRLSKLRGFSLIELIIAISVSSVLIGSIFYLFSNIKTLEILTSQNSKKASDIAYTYHLLKDDLSNSIPGTINDELSIYLNNKNELILHRVTYDNFDQFNLNIVKVIWRHDKGKLFRSLSSFGNNKDSYEKLVFDFNTDINFKIEKINKLKYFLSSNYLSPSIISLIIGSKIDEIYTFKVGNN